MVMVSFTVQLAVLLVLAFGLGIFVGHLLWIHGWRRRIDGEAARLPQLEAEHAAALGELDEQRGEVQQLYGEAQQRETELEQLQRQLHDREVQLESVVHDAGHDHDGDHEHDDEVARLEARVAALTVDLDEARSARAALDARAARADEFRRRARRAEAQARRLRARLAGPRDADRLPPPAASDLDEADADDADDLTRIEGIGPAMAGALRSGGIGDFETLRSTDVTEVRRVLARAGLRFAPSAGTWAEQAGHLARGDLDAFDELNARLFAGRRARA